MPSGASRAFTTSGCAKRSSSWSSGCASRSNSTRVAREAGLSRPHFYKLFRQQVGVTPNIYLNSLRMERAIERLTGTNEAVAAIGLDLGFSSQASFSRFFIANGVVPPSTYRRSAQIAYSQ